ncbi:hypothetical protein ACFS07_19525 [Undibacterium arcticum]
MGIDWPMGGLPRSLHLDNGAEFHSKALGRDCTQFGIELTYRPPGRPQFGGHIERIIGTLMTKLKKTAWRHRPLGQEPEESRSREDCSPHPAGI